MYFINSRFNYENNYIVEGDSEEQQAYENDFAYLNEVLNNIYNLY